MAGITLDQAQQKLDNALAALDQAMATKRVARGSQAGNREVMQQDVTQLQNAVDYWDRKVKILTAQQTGSGRISTPVHRG